MACSPHAGVGAVKTEILVRLLVVEGLPPPSQAYRRKYTYAADAVGGHWLMAGVVARLTVVWVGCSAHLSVDLNAHGVASRAQVRSDRMGVGTIGNSHEYPWTCSRDDPPKAQSSTQMTYRATLWPKPKATGE